MLCSHNVIRLLRQRLSSLNRHVAFQSSSSYGMPKNYYSILGVNKTSTQRQIKAAYYQLSKKYHPDVAGSDSSAQARFLEINEAYECLRDPDRRNAYDNNDFKQKTWQWQSTNQQHRNPFHSRQYTQQEYDRIWEQFNRMRNERETYDSKINWEKQKMWEAFERQRAERWQQFHQKYPNGPPGQIKWEWKWPPNTSSSTNPNQRKDIVRKILLIYLATFFVVSFVRVLFFGIGENPEKKMVITEKKPEQPPLSEKEKLAYMMNRHPVTQDTVPSEMNYMNKPPMPEQQQETTVSTSTNYSNPSKEYTTRDSDLWHAQLNKPPMSEQQQATVSSNMNYSNPSTEYYSTRVSDQWNAQMQEASVMMEYPTGDSESEFTTYTPIQVESDPNQMR